MIIENLVLPISTEDSIGIYNLTDLVQAKLSETGIVSGHVLLFSRHTTTALAINEYEERLLVDLKAYLRKLAPPTDRYLHNDLHLREVPPDEPENAHSHLMAMTLHNSELVPIVDGRLALGTYQSILFVELDGPRDRTLHLQFQGIP